MHPACRGPRRADRNKAGTGISAGLMHYAPIFISNRPTPTSGKRMGVVMGCRPNRAPTRIVRSGGSRAARNAGRSRHFSTHARPGLSSRHELSLAQRRRSVSHPEPPERMRRRVEGSRAANLLAARFVWLFLASLQARSFDSRTRRQAFKQARSFRSNAGFLRNGGYRWSIR
jgi:hypothetical protein